MGASQVRRGEGRGLDRWEARSVCPQAVSPPVNIGVMFRSTFPARITPVCTSPCSPVPRPLGLSRVWVKAAESILAAAWRILGMGSSPGLPSGCLWQTAFFHHKAGIKLLSGLF